MTSVNSKVTLTSFFLSGLPVTSLEKLHLDEMDLEPWSGVGGTTAIWGTAFGANGSTLTKLVVGFIAAKPINISEPHSFSSSDAIPSKYN